MTMTSPSQEQTFVKPVSLSVVEGVTSPPLVSLTLGELLDQQCLIRGPYEAIVCPKTNSRWTYNTLREESMLIAQGLLSLGVKAGDRVGILAGNCAEYIAVFFAAGYLGCILVVLNNTYTTPEAINGIQHSGCRVLFVVEKIGRLDRIELIKALASHGKPPALENIIMLRGTRKGFMGYRDLKNAGKRQPKDALVIARRVVRPDDVCNLQYTSGSTGHPKAAMLTHFNLINNATSIGDRLEFTHKDILCCPPPLFHCFGLVLGVLAILTHGAKIVLPAEIFDTEAALNAISDEKCTALHGVPTMFEELLNLKRPAGFNCDSLRTGIIAGAPVPRPLMKRLVSELNMTEFTSSYGLTETSPTCFNAYTYDTIDTRLTTVGQILPHLRAKIVDRSGDIVPLGVRGELCIAGYSLQKGYWNNPEKTNETMIRDKDGVLWLHTGDEASFNDRGYCTITGRFKDIIIRGGENIYPVEVEVRLAEHPAIARAAVVGIQDSRLGEVVGAFLQREVDVTGNLAKKLSDDEVKAWTREVLARHKTPAYIFWLGDEGLESTIPQTGSGKIKKHELRTEGERIVKKRKNGNRLEAKL